MPRAPFDLLIAAALAAFQDRYPDVELEIAVEGRLVDIVRQGYDGGFRYGDVLDRDMVAIPVAPRSDAVLVASPAYLRTRTLPDCPRDLLDHRAVVCRSHATGAVRPWKLRSAGQTVRIAPPAATIVHDLASQIELTLQGLGIVCAPASSVADLLDAGKLTRVLPAWSSPLEALFLYFPSRRHQSAALRAFVTFMKNGSRQPLPARDREAPRDRASTCPA